MVEATPKARSPDIYRCIIILNGRVIMHDNSYRCGSSCTLWQTSDIKLVVKFLIDQLIQRSVFDCPHVCQPLKRTFSNLKALCYSEILHNLKNIKLHETHVQLAILTSKLFVSQNCRFVQSYKFIYAYRISDLFRIQHHVFVIFVEAVIMHKLSQKMCRTNVQNKLAHVLYI